MSEEGKGITAPSLNFPVTGLEIPDEYKNYNFRDCWTAADDTGPYYPEDVIAAIYHTHGSLGEMAVLLKRNRMRVRDYVWANREVKEVFDSVRESTIDLVEKSHMGLAIRGDATAQRFILETIGKERGYSRRVEQTGKNGEAIAYTQVTRVIVDPDDDKESAERRLKDLEGTVDGSGNVTIGSPKSGNTDS